MRSNDLFNCSVYELSCVEVLWLIDLLVPYISLEDLLDLNMSSFRNESLCCPGAEARGV
jgi:hypothetical protein